MRTYSVRHHERLLGHVEALSLEAACDAALAAYGSVSRNLHIEHVTKHQQALQAPERRCFLHEDRPAAGDFTIPCAPEGKLPVCQERLDSPLTSPLRKAFFDKYLASHRANVVRQRAQEEQQ